MVRRKKKAKILGITGGIGSGQSTVAGLLKDKGVHIIDADQKGRDVLVRFPEIIAELANNFGNEILMDNGRLNRGKLGEIVFADRYALQKLNAMVHPRMIELILNELEETRYSKEYAFVAIDAALLYEIQMESVFDLVLCVDAPLEQRIKRVMKRNHLSKQAVQERIQSQLPLEDKAEWADFVIPNDGDLQDLRERVDLFWEKING